jgi:hypothetical protein
MTYWNNVKQKFIKNISHNCIYSAFFRYTIPKFFTSNIYNFDDYLDNNFGHIIVWK